MQKQQNEAAKTGFLTQSFCVALHKFLEARFSYITFKK